MTRNRNVRNTTKFKRSIKAISPVIATLLMIAIAVVASLVAYAWVMGYIGFTTNNAGKAIQIQSFATSGTGIDPVSNRPNGPLIIYVQNVGQGQVQLKQDGSVFVNGDLKNILQSPRGTTLTPAQLITVDAGQTVELLVDYIYTSGVKVDIKVTTTDGTFMTKTGTGSQGGSSNPAVATKLAFSSGAGQALTVNVVSGAIVIQRQTDAGAAVSTGTSAITVTLSSSGAGTFYSDAGTTPLIGSQITIAAGASSATFYYKATAVGTSPHTLTAASSPLASATSDFPVSAANPVATKLAFSSGAGQALTVNVVSGAIVIQRQTDAGAAVSTGTSAITVTLSSSGAGTFYSDAGTTPLIGSQITIAAGASSATFYYKATAVGTSPHTLTAASSPLASATSDFPVSAANPVATKLAFSSGAGQALTVNVVSGAIVIQRQTDAGAAVSTGTSAITVTLSSSGAGTFYSDAGTTPLIGSQITIAAGASSATFYYKATAVGTSPHTLTAASSPLASATSDFPVSAATAPAPTIDTGSRQSTNTIETPGGNHMHITLTTANPNEVLYLSFVGAGGVTASVASTGTSAWTQRADILTDTGTGANHHLQTFYAVKAASGETTITITLTGGDSGSRVAAVAFGISGANTASASTIFDGNARTSRGTSTSPAVSVTTNSANELVIAALGAEVGTNPTVGAGFTLIRNQLSTGNENQARLTSAEYQTVSTAQPLSATYTIGASDDWGMVAEAIKAP